MGNSQAQGRFWHAIGEGKYDVASGVLALTLPEPPLKATFVEYSKWLPLDKRRQFGDFIVTSLISKAANKVVELCGATQPEEKKPK